MCDIVLPMVVYHCSTMAIVQFKHHLTRTQKFNRILQFNLQFDEINTWIISIGYVWEHIESLIVAFNFLNLHWYYQFGSFNNTATNCGLQIVEQFIRSDFVEFFDSYMNHMYYILSILYYIVVHIALVYD